MNEVLFILCFTAVSHSPLEPIIPSTYISKTIGKSLYQTRKELKKLKEEGLVVSDRYCMVGEDQNYIVSGYIITDKAKSTPEYKQAWEKERRLCKEILDIDIGDPDDDERKEWEV